MLAALKSELNFPIGEREPLEPSPERWTCAIHLLDAIFYMEGERMSVDFQKSSRAHRICAKPDEPASPQEQTITPEPFESCSQWRRSRR